MIDRLGLFEIFIRIEHFFVENWREEDLFEEGFLLELLERRLFNEGIEQSV
jgi:hypothetical protein